MRRIAANNGRDPDEVPDITPFRILTIKDLVHLTGLSQSSIYVLMARGAFPRGMPMDTASIAAAAPVPTKAPLKGQQTRGAAV